MLTAASSSERAMRLDPQGRRTSMVANSVTHVESSAVDEPIEIVRVAFVT